MLVAFYREIYEANMNDFGKMMKAAEVAGVAIYFTCLIKAVFNFLSWNVNASEFQTILDNLLSR